MIFTSFCFLFLYPSPVILLTLCPIPFTVCLLAGPPQGLPEIEVLVGHADPHSGLQLTPFGTTQISPICRNTFSNRTGRSPT
jgi:hypothetical protein